MEIERAGKSGFDRGKALRADARHARSLADRARRFPQIRDARVEALRQQVAAGTYRVDTGRLARAMMEFEDGLGR